MKPLMAKLMRGRSESGWHSTTHAQLAELRARVSSLEAAIYESRSLNERLSDVIDIVVELLVPAVDRDEARLRELLTGVGAAAPVQPNED
jgi:hypothetical protein